MSRSLRMSEAELDQLTAGLEKHLTEAEQSLKNWCDALQQPTPIARDGPPWLVETARAVRFWVESFDEKTDGLSRYSVLLPEVLIRVPEIAGWMLTNKYPGDMKTWIEKARDVALETARKLYSAEAYQSPLDAHAARKLRIRACEAMRELWRYLEVVLDGFSTAPASGGGGDDAPKWSDTMPMKTIADALSLRDKRWRAVEPKVLALGGELKRVRRGNYQVRYDGMNATQQAKFAPSA